MLAALFRCLCRDFSRRGLFGCRSGLDNLNYRLFSGLLVALDAHELEEAVEGKRIELGQQRMARFEKYFGNSFGELSNGKKRLPGFKQLNGIKKGLVRKVSTASSK